MPLASRSSRPRPPPVSMPALRFHRSESSSLSMPTLCSFIARAPSRPRYIARLCVRNDAFNHSTKNSQIMETNHSFSPKINTATFRPRVFQIFICFSRVCVCVFQEKRVGYQLSFSPHPLIIPPHLFLTASPTTLLPPLSSRADASGLRRPHRHHWSRRRHLCGAGRCAGLYRADLPLRRLDAAGTVRAPKGSAMSSLYPNFKSQHRRVEFFSDILFFITIRKTLSQPPDF